jgi:hypothetical protein
MMTSPVSTCRAIDRAGTKASSERLATVSVNGMEMSLFPAQQWIRGGNRLARSRDIFYQI